VVRILKRDPTPFDRLLRRLSRQRTLVVSDMNLQHIGLRRRALLGIEFRRCELAFADFAGADLSYVRFTDCNLYRADFSNAVLYTTWFYECNLTRATFAGSYLLGLRFRTADLTKTTFDDAPAVGLERKVRDDDVPGALSVGLLGRLPCDAPELEQRHRGIRMARHERTIAFLRDGDSVARRRIRLAETAKYLKIAHVENGYEQRARHYYVVERRQRRKAMQGTVAARARRAQDYVFGDLVWRYGTSALRPVVTLAVTASLAAALTLAAPAGDHATGLRPEGTKELYALAGWNTRSVENYLNVLYFFLTAPAGGSQDELLGWVKLVFVVYLLTALWLIALTFEASTRRLGSSP
jgi:Pentapeptide repeats (8 copies)